MGTKLISGGQLSNLIIQSCCLGCLFRFAHFGLSIKSPGRTRYTSTGKGGARCRLCLNHRCRKGMLGAVGAGQEVQTWRVCNDRPQRRYSRLLASLPDCSPAITAGMDERNCQSMNRVAAGWHIEQFTVAVFLHYPFCHGLRDIKPDFLEVSRLRVI